ncbi:protein phosphatase 2C family protein [Candidatus Saccharibacteria bacterium]|nr:protein phosphatase 2C family protein [Candidatus Saccharibacteria bacterium]
MGLFNQNKVKNTSEQPVNSAAKEWDFSDVKFQGGVKFQGDRNNADIQKNSNQNYGNREKAATEQQFDRVIDRNTGNAVSITHEQSQENKIINLFQASLGSPDMPLSQDKQNFYNRLNSGDFSEADEENFIQNNLVGPTEKLVNGEKYFDMKATGHVFDNIINNPQLKKIFREAVNNYDQNYQSQLTGLLSQYPTPKQFDKIGKEIAIHAYERDKSTFAPTKQALETFKHLIYGKQYEYQKAFDALREKAQNFAANQAKNQDIHSGTFNIPNYAEPKYQALKNYEQSPLPEVAAATISKANKMLAGNKIVHVQLDNNETSYDRVIGSRVLSQDEKNNLYNRLRNVENEDRAYVDNKNRVYAVFDGAGGIGPLGGKFASQACFNAIKEYVDTGRLKNDYEQHDQSVNRYKNLRDQESDPAERQDIENVINHMPSPLANLAPTINKRVLREGEQGWSTGIVAKLSEDNSRLDYMNVGDSRLYIIRNGQFFQMSHDEGVGRRIANGFGNPNFKAEQFNSVDVYPEDIVILCSDGVMGDYKEQEIGSATLNHIARSRDPQKIVGMLTAESHKADDTTIVAFRIPNSNNQNQPMAYNSTY